MLRVIPQRREQAAGTFVPFARLAAEARSEQLRRNEDAPAQQEHDDEREPAAVFPGQVASSVSGIMPLIPDICSAATWPVRSTVCYDLGL
jgi:hypothetical protein